MVYPGCCCMGAVPPDHHSQVLMLDVSIRCQIVLSHHVAEMSGRCRHARCDHAYDQGCECPQNINPANAPSP